MPSCSASDWYSISTWILVRQEVNTVPEMRARLEPALARPARYGDIYRYRRYACTAVRFLDVNGIFEKRIIRTFGKCTRH